MIYAQKIYTASAGGNIGTTGITASNISFIRVN